MSTHHKIPLLVIAGSTAVGKTAAALELASNLNGELIGADSVQVYRGFDIGSAKPTEEELEGVSHAMIDIIDADEPIDAMKYARLADKEIERIHKAGKLPIVVGGTGLWIRALLRGLMPLPPVDLALRASLEKEFEEKGAGVLFERLMKVDPISAERTHANNSVRVVRSLEVFEQTGKPISELQKNHALGEPRFKDYFVFLEEEKETHQQNIRKRVDEMLHAGWIQETKSLIEKWGQHIKPLQSVGYRQILDYLNGELSDQELPEAIYKSTRLYARRQKTWFQKEPGVGLRTHPRKIFEKDFLFTVKNHLKKKEGL